MLLQNWKPLFFVTAFKCENRLFCIKMLKTLNRLKGLYTWKKNFGRQVICYIQYLQLW